MLPVLSVSEFISQINGIIAGEFIVEGEISQLKQSNGKWIFFDLKDDAGCISCFSMVFWVKVPLEEGMRVRVIGYPKIYEKNGRFSFTAQRVELVGEGALQRAFQLLKEKLETEGLFAPERKRLLPQLPERIGVIASGDSAAWGDFKRIVHNRWGGVELVLRHVQVQGDRAISDIVQAFQEFNSAPELCEVLVLMRGGGSLEDLAAFNSEEVVRAMYSSHIPIVTGVGHERDVTLADLVADVRASTPSNAAEMVVPERREFVAGIEFDLEHIATAFERNLRTKKQVLEQYSYIVLSRLESPLLKTNALISSFGNSLVRIEKQLAQSQSLITTAEVLFKNVDPKRVLERGYSITRTANGTIIKSPHEVDRGETVVIELARGRVKAEIESPPRRGPARAGK